MAARLVRVLLCAGMAFVCGPAIVAQGPSDVPAKVREVGTVAAQGPFAPSWDSLARYQVPDWYQDAKFGIFIHWGVYSVPAFGNEWYPRNMYKRGRAGVRAPRRDLRPAIAVRLQGLHPAVQGGAVRRGAMGRACSRQPAHATSCRSPSTTTASRCTTAASRRGLRPRWARSATSSASSPRRFGRRASCSACRPTAPSTGGSSTRA